MSDEIINYHDLSEHEKDKALRQLNGLGFTPAYGSISCMKNEMEKSKGHTLLYGDNVFEKDGIRRDRTGDGEKTRCLCGKRGIFNRDGPAMGPQIIRQLE